MCESRIYTLVFVHTAVWLFALFGCLVLGKKAALFNILILLPIIYVFQSLPVHLILKEKMKYVLSHKDCLKKNENMLRSHRSDCDDEHVSKVTGIPIDDVIDSYKYITYYEDLFPLNALNRKLAFMFSDISYMNPLSPQGLILLSFIINIYYLKFTHVI